MQITVKADEAQKALFLSKGVPEDVQISWFQHGMKLPFTEAYFDLTFAEEGASFSQIRDRPVFVNAVEEISTQLPANAIRINAWPGFLERKFIEIVADTEQKKTWTSFVLNALGWHFQLVPDIPGMIAPRTIAMIINEAYFALGEGVSSKEEIDIAMKLGTNYPMGPFEWSETIGLEKIYRLLTRLAITDNRYAAAPLMQTVLNPKKQGH